VSDQRPVTSASGPPASRGRIIAVALVLILPIALLVVWFQASNHDDAWDLCRTDIEQRLAPDDVSFTPGDHYFTDDGRYAVATGTLTSGGATYAYRCTVQNGVVDLRLEPR
jgi:hypothetical protein